VTDVPRRILLVEDDVEDDDDHAELFRLAFPDRGVRPAGTAEAALAVLLDPGTPRPDLVGRDLEPSGHDGLHVLRRVRDEPRLAGLPAAVLTTSRARRDRIAVAEIGADAYDEKPTGGDDLARLQERIDGRWPRWRRRPA